MKNLLTIVFCSLITLLSYGQNTPLAFPEAEGFGRYATGGRGGNVYHVTKLTDDGSIGTLRYAVNQSGPRTIVFDVSGNIELTSGLTIKNGNLTIAGQTAPGDGICIKNHTLNVDADNVIIRYLRFRTGDEATMPGDEAREYDAAWGRYRNNVIIDHCSFSWANDEVCSFYHNTNFTLQWCIISESFYLSTHPKGAHGYGGIWGGYNASFHHNLLAHHSSRNPRFSGQRGDNSIENVDFRNNVIYNWGGNSSYGGESGRHNMVNNYYKKGPATKSGVVSYRIIQPSDAVNQTPVYSKWYVDGNYVVGNTTVSGNNWSGGVQPYQTTVPIDSFKATTPFTYAPVNTEIAQDAFTSVLKKAGCSYPKRDTVDARIIDETKNGTVHFGGTYGTNKGIIDSQTTVGGYPQLASTPAALDSDKDGMPDFWENQKGLNPNDASDGKTDNNSDGYTNLEEYLNDLPAGKVIQTPTGMSVPVNEQFVLHPNPVKDWLYVSGATASTNFEVKILNLSGQVIVNKQSGNDSSYRINCSVLKSGIYFCKIRVDQNVVVQKILKN